ncbi:AMP-binding protein [Noviherbaspirillum sedimenti]|uniref:Acyl-CoA synthetase n=1 Tax=Noviherbaspirillum sedimenti TaxID=2320865 RepID=A0A3A3G840_9BURK|nr:AMP-binding protein [Noviherbaspirillum sedimenti]RJG02919.1 acyl-CoA synthetase [Noviherbaspirillum sedimenti]
MDKQTLLQELRRDGELVTKRLEHWARQTPERTCFYYGEDNIALSFAEFNRLSDQIAGNLAAAGITKGMHVSVFMRNQLITALAMFGIWKAGAVFCPVNFGLTGRLLAYQIGDTRPALLIAERALVPMLDEIADQMDSVRDLVVYDAPTGAHDHVEGGARFAGALPERPWEELLRPAQKPAIQLEYDDRANIIYTSGTTGPAKGVVQSHRWMNQYTFLFRQLLDQDDVVYNDLPLYHVGGAVYNVVRAVWAGCASACWDRFSPNQFWQRIATSNATSAVLVDTMISWLAKADPLPTDRNNTLNKVHMQPLPDRHVEISQRFGFDYVTAGFGQTESGMSCFTIIEETDDSNGTPPAFLRGLGRTEIRARAARYGVPVLPVERAGTVGKGHMGLPSVFVEAAILDERDRECAAGEPGQLAFRSRLPSLLLHEYLGKPEATAKAFRNLWFHTGDSARRNSDGTYNFVDRMGDRIRVRGENISSFHIEDMINQCPGVGMTAAFAVPAEDGDEDDVVVFVAVRDGQTLSEQLVLEWSEQNMPKFMRPRYVRVVEDLPRTLTQKVEKFKLKKRILEELGRG